MNEIIAKQILSILSRAKEPLSRAQIANKLGCRPEELPLFQMRFARRIKMHGAKRHAKYSLLLPRS